MTRQDCWNRATSSVSHTTSVTSRLSPSATLTFISRSGWVMIWNSACSPRRIEAVRYRPVGEIVMPSTSGSAANAATGARFVAGARHGANDRHGEEYGSASAP